MDLLQYNSFYLVGIKGVAMTSLAQLLLDAGKQVRGSDVAEDFPTKFQLDRLSLTVDTEFTTPLPADVDCVIHTGAHGGQTNPQVVWAKENNLPTITHAQALAFFFNQKQGIAVCGVGGKSTISAMITWILSSLHMNPSFSVGVGNIPGIDRTGAWTDAKYFVAEADEYVEDPTVINPTNEITPRFAYLKPFMIVTPNLRFDHPDVYKDFDHTKEIFSKFFEQINHGGALIVNNDDEQLMQLARKSPAQIITFGEAEFSDFQLTNYQSQAGHTQSTFNYQDQEYSLKLQVPGKFNALNALAAIAACAQLNPAALTNHNLDQFRSTARRFENIGLIDGIQCFDDYAHHPHEIKAAIKALNEWYPAQRKVIAFQSHTFSRTKQLFVEFVDSFADATEVVMTDIFSSAREQADPTVSSTTLCEAIEEKYPNIKAKNLGTNESLANYFKTELKPGDVFLTLGAGDIYEVFESLKS
ncbi:MAG: UDP-N-acetylmuramate--L-alanine ligase [Candidatus Paceibacterota bacterium]